MRLQKKEIAKRQIEVALDLFFSDGDPLAIITLAGAAEEVLGGLLRRREKRTMMEYLVDLDRRLTGGRDPKVVNEEVNGVRNNLKHANNPDEDELDVDPCHAVAMLARAIANYSSLDGDVTPPMLRFYADIKTQIFLGCCFEFLGRPLELARLGD